MIVVEELGHVAKRSKPMSPTLTLPKKRARHRNSSWRPGRRWSR